VATPQFGIFAVGTSAHCFLEFTLRPENAAPDLVRAVADIEEPHTTVGGVNIVVGVRPTIWAQVAPEDVPAGANDFEAALVGVGRFAMPATQRDAWIWIAGAAADLVFDVAIDIIAALEPVALLATEITGWSYRHSRDLTGFEDGTENPPLTEAPGVALVPAGQPGQGCSVVLYQQWVHHREAWTGIGLRTQEKVMGRTKDDSTEFAEDVMLPNSHVARTSIETGDGEELPIFRRNVPYGTVSDHGTVFVGFSFDQSRLTRMLERMAGIEDGIRDALTYYTTPLTGAYYVVPSIEALQAFASPIDDTLPTTSTTNPVVAP
jgi:porphyrinogen peroxidase